jgi:hypothetical protein
MLVPWIGVDFDGTLIDAHERPVPAMVKKIKAHLADGIKVKIVTARMSRHTIPGWPPAEIQERMLAEWSLEHLGQALEATCEKDYMMKFLYDDLAIEIVRNTGLTPDEFYEKYRDGN